MWWEDGDGSNKQRILRIRIYPFALAKLKNISFFPFFLSLNNGNLLKNLQSRLRKELFMNLPLKLMLQIPSGDRNKTPSVSFLKLKFKKKRIFFERTTLHIHALKRKIYLNLFFRIKINIFLNTNEIFICRYIYEYFFRM